MVYSHQMSLLDISEITDCSQESESFCFLGLNKSDVDECLYMCDVTSHFLSSSGVSDNCTLEMYQFKGSTLLSRFYFTKSYSYLLIYRCLSSLRILNINSKLNVIVYFQEKHRRNLVRVKTYKMSYYVSSLQLYIYIHLEENSLVHIFMQKCFLNIVFYYQGVKLFNNLKSICLLLFFIFHPITKE